MSLICDFFHFENFGFANKEDFNECTVAGYNKTFCAVELVSCLRCFLTPWWIKSNNSLLICDFCRPFRGEKSFKALCFNIFDSWFVTHFAFIECVSNSTLSLYRFVYSIWMRGSLSSSFPSMTAATAWKAFDCDTCNVLRGQKRQSANTKKSMDFLLTFIIIFASIG